MTDSEQEGFEEFLENFVEHFLALPRSAQNRSHLYRVLTNFEKYLTFKLSLTGIQPILDDYTQILRAEFAFTNEQQSSLTLIQDALQLSASTLADSSDVLDSQLYARLLPHREQTEIATFLQQIVAREEPWLRPLNTTLTPSGAPLRYTLTAPRAPAVLSPDGAYLIAATEVEGEIGLWAMENGARVEAVTRHSAPLADLHFTPDGTWLVSGSEDGTVQLWQYHRTEQVQLQWLKTITHPSTDVGEQKHHILFVSQHQFIGCWGESYGEQTLTLWSLDQGTALHSLTSETELTQVIPVPDRPHVLLVAPLTITVWDIERGEIIHTIAKTSGRIETALLLPTHQHLITGDNRGQLSLFDLETESPNHRIAESPERLTFTAHLRSPISQLRLSSDGQSVISAGHDGKLHWWSIADCLARARSSPPNQSSTQPIMVSQEIGEITDIAAFPHQPWVLVGTTQNKAIVYDWQADRIIQHVSGSYGWQRGVAVSPSGKQFLAPGARSSFNVWEVETGERIHQMRGHERYIQGVAITRDGLHALSVDTGGKMVLWDFVAGRAITTLHDRPEQFAGLVLTPDGQHALTISQTESVGVGLLRNWNLAAEVEVGQRSYPGNLSAVAISPDGEQIMVATSGHKQGLIAVWSYRTDEQYLLSGHTGTINKLQVTPDSRYLISASDDATIRIWDIKQEAQVAMLADDQFRVTSIALTTDGTHVISVSSGQLKIWNLTQIIQQAKLASAPNVEPTQTIESQPPIYDFRLLGHQELLVQHQKEISRLASDTGMLLQTLPIEDKSKSTLLSTDNACAGWTVDFDFFAHSRKPASAV